MNCQIALRRHGLPTENVTMKQIFLNAIMMEVIVVLTPMFRVSVPYVFVMMIDKIKEGLDVLRTLQIHCFELELIIFELQGF